MAPMKATSGRKLIFRIAPLACAALLGLGAAACSSGGTSHTQNSPTPAASTPSTAPPTTAAKSGGAGF
jgi:hypothetical protein